MQKIVIFDMDGTLIDSKKDITISINHIRKKHYSLEPLSESFVVEAINKEVRNLPKLFYGTEEYMSRDRELFEEHYAKQCTQNPYLYDELHETLEILHTRGVKLAVATNAPTKFAKLMLSSLNVVDMFGIILGADKVSISKPNPEMLYKILEFYDYNHEQDKAWMIGDNSKDVASADAANIEVLFATWGFASKSEYKNTLKRPKEILDTVL